MSSKKERRQALLAATANDPNRSPGERQAATHLLRASTKTARLFSSAPILPASLDLYL